MYACRCPAFAFLHAGRDQPAVRRASVPTGITAEPEGRPADRGLTMQIPAVSRAKRSFFVGGLRRAGAALPRATPRTATDTPRRSALIPRSHSSSRSRSPSSPPDRRFASPGGPDACAAATNSASDSFPDARGSRCGACVLRPPLHCSIRPHTRCDRGLPPAALPIAARSLRDGDGRCWSRRSRPPLRHETIACTRACSIARATSGWARTSGAVLARWPAASCRLDRRDMSCGGGLIQCVSDGVISSRPMIACPAAARSSSVKDMVPH